MPRCAVLSAPLGADRTPGFEPALEPEPFFHVPQNAYGALPEAVPPGAVHGDSVRELVRCAQRGEEGGYSGLYARFEPQLRRLVKSRLGLELGQHLEAEDVVQETFLAAFLALDRHDFRSEAAFFGWLARIAARKLQDAVRFYRREKRTPQAGYFATEPARGDGPPSSEPCTPLEDPLESLGRRELGSLAARCLDHLTPELRAVVVWREVHDVPWHLIAERLGRRTIGAARHLHEVACCELARRMKLQVGSAL